MIRINLLPEQYRHRGRPSILELSLVAGSALLFTGSAAYLGYVYFGLLSSATTERTQIEEQIAGMKPQVQYHTELLAEKSDYETRETKIRQIGASRILWTRKLDQFADIINAGEDAGRYMIWFDGLEANQTVDLKGESGGKLKAKGFSGSSNYANVPAFYADVEGTEFFRDFKSINYPAAKQTDGGKDLIPSQILEFDLGLELQPPPKEKQAPPTAKPAAPAANAAPKKE